MHSDQFFFVVFILVFWFYIACGGEMQTKSENERTKWREKILYLNGPRSRKVESERVRDREKERVQRHFSKWTFIFSYYFHFDHSMWNLYDANICQTHKCIGIAIYDWNKCHHRRVHIHCTGTCWMPSIASKLFGDKCSGNFSDGSHARSQ